MFFPYYLPFPSRPCFNPLRQRQNLAIIQKDWRRRVDKWRRIGQIRLHAHLPNGYDTSTFHAQIWASGARLQRSSVYLRRRSCLWQAQSESLIPIPFPSSSILHFPPSCTTIHCVWSPLSYFHVLKRQKMLEYPNSTPQIAHAPANMSDLSSPAAKSSSTSSLISYLVSVQFIFIKTEAK